MKSVSITSALLLFIVINGIAQPPDIEINELTSPALPAFVIMGISPDEISRPVTMKALTTNLQQAVGKSGFAEDVAIEFSPYWLKSGRKSDFYDYYGIERSNTDSERKSNFGKNAYETLAFSLGTSSYTAADSVKGKNMGLGIRAQWLTGKASESLKTLVDIYLFNPSEVRAVANNLIDLLEENSGANKDSLFEAGITAMINMSNRIAQKDKAAAIVEMKKFFKSKTENKSGDALNNTLAEINRTYQTETVKYFIDSSAAVNQRVGWILETSAALMLDFPSNNFGLSYGRKAGFWAALSYRMPKAPANDFTFMLRLIKSGNELRTNSFDLGGRYSYSQKTFMLGGEFLYRHTSEKEKVTFGGKDGFFITMNNGYRFSLNGQYRLSDFIILNLTFGKDYDNEFSSGELIAQLGAGFSLFQKQLLRF